MSPVACGAFESLKVLTWHWYIFNIFVFQNILKINWADIIIWSHVEEHTALPKSSCVQQPKKSLNPILLGFYRLGFPGGSEAKVSACNAGDLDSILGSGRAPGEGTGNPLQYSCLENPMDGEAWWAYNPWGCKESDRTEWLHFTFNVDWLHHWWLNSTSSPSLLWGGLRMNLKVPPL